MSEQRKLFDYLLTDAWHAPISQVTVFEGDQSWVRFTTRHHVDFYHYSLEDQHFDIDNSVIEAIKEILVSANIETITSLEEVWVLDGCINEFSFCLGNKQKTVIGYNIDYCLKEPEQCPKAMAMINMLKQVEALLVPLGVDKACFKLSID